MAAVIRPADARLSASTMIMSSIRVSLVGAQVDCSTNTSLPRTFSWISTMISPSEKRLTIALPRGIPRILTTSCASAGFALPVNTIRPSLLIVHLFWLEARGKTREILAGEEGFEPSHAGIKIQCLNQLGDSPTQLTACRHVGQYYTDYFEAKQNLFLLSTTRRASGGGSALLLSRLSRYQAHY